MKRRVGAFRSTAAEHTAATPAPPLAFSTPPRRTQTTGSAQSIQRLNRYLIQYLVRLVTPPRGTVLDCFAGSGTTGEAAWREGFSAILIEREPEYLADIERRMSLALAGPDERSRESIKARLVGKPMDAGPLFGALP